MKRIGIFSGMFDPIHKGHVGFALKALKEAGLDDVYLLIEAQPRRKTGLTHLSHRLAMAKLATAHYAHLKVLELPDRQFSVAKTLPRIQKRFPDSQLVILMGSDSLHHLPGWPLVERLLDQAELFIGLRQGMGQTEAEELLNELPKLPHKIWLTNSPAPTVSSKQIRLEVHKGQTNHLLPSLRSYVKKEWLYAVPSAGSSSTN